jgi:hypothetical protein
MLHSASLSSATAAYGYDYRQPGITRVSLASCSAEGNSTHSPESAAMRGDCTQRTTESLKVAREPTPDNTLRNEALEISFCYEPIPGRLTEVQVELMLEHRTRRLAKQPDCPTREIRELA